MKVRPLVIIIIVTTYDQYNGSANSNSLPVPRLTQPLSLMTNGNL